MVLIRVSVLSFLPRSLSIGLTELIRPFTNHSALTLWDRFPFGIYKYSYNYWIAKLLLIFISFY